MKTCKGAKYSRIGNVKEFIYSKEIKLIDGERGNYIWDSCREVNKLEERFITRETVE
jgi:hypothetical protein